MRPARSAFVLGWLQRFGMSGTRPNAFFDFYVKGPNGAWTFVALVVHEALVSIVEGEESDGHELGELLRRKGEEIQTVVGPNLAVKGFVDALMPQDFEPRVLQLQTLMQRPRALGIPPLSDVPLPLRYAVNDDIPRVVVASLSMHEEEVGTPNTEGDQEALMRSAYQKVREDRVWVLTDPNGELIFKASTSLPTSVVAQVEGVWTNPQARGRGFAKRCMEQICEELYERYALISLTVASDNTPALCLYENLGFEPVADWRTVYLDPADEDPA